MGLLDILSGNDEGCDLLTILYDGMPSEGYYLGNRDIVTGIGAIMLDMAVIGVTAQSGYKSFETLNDI